MHGAPTGSDAVGFRTMPTDIATLQAANLLALQSQGDALG